METTYLAMLLSLPIIIFPLYFSSRPTFGRLLLLVGCGIAYFISIEYLNIFTQSLRVNLILWYSIACYFVLSLTFQNNVHLFYANVLGFNIGWAGISIPVISWKFSDDFNFINIFGVPIWKPFSYISMLRKYYDRLDITEIETSHQAMPNLIPKKSQIQVSRSKFHKLIRVDPKEKYGSCYLFLSGTIGTTKFVAYVDRSLLQIKPVRNSEDRFKIAYIKRIGWEPQLNKNDLYDFFGTFLNITINGKILPGIYVRAIRKHKKGFSPNLFIHWISTILFLITIVITLTI
ncbi:hypothetical protein JYT87_02210 [Nitrospira defluvii]|nr:hypothetical protein [Nitrospira defluvii]